MLTKKVLSFASHDNLFSPGETLVVAVSGGPDSVCLLHILTRLMAPININLHVAHLNHGLRGAESDADADYVRQLSLSLGIPSTIEKRNVESFRLSHHLSLEEAARAVRYSFLSEVAATIGSRKVAVGHTADDQVETILHHFIRGSGLTGLRGMLPETNWNINETEKSITVIRPLLGVTRKETEHYCTSYELSPRFDASNLSLSFTRNRIRLELLPYLRSMNSRIDQAILRLSNAVGQDLEVLEGAAADLFTRSAVKRDGSISFKKSPIVEAPESLQRHLFRLAIGLLLGDTTNVEMVHIEAILDSLKKPAGTSLTLPRDLVFMVDYGEFTISLKQKVEPPYPVVKETYPINVPGETNIPGWIIVTRIEKAESYETVTNNLPWQAHLDLAVAGKDIFVRGRVGGDRFRPLGMASLKKLQDFMVDEKIPSRWRDSIPILANNNQILWVVGLRIDDRAKFTDRTTEFLHIEFRPALADIA